jgi:hypothetical protein
MMVCRAEAHGLARSGGALAQQPNQLADEVQQKRKKDG